MPTLDQLDAIASYCDDQQLYTDCLYHPPSDKFRPRSLRPGPVIWIVKDGKAIDFTDVKCTEK